ncbi:prevent-host-death family protein [Streptomyces sp. LE64]|uniref:prevent-host-death family protein n=1 Tax=Streptomyces sp. LE64 TaxID=3448653 RepID=UPI0040422CD1
MTTYKVVLNPQAQHALAGLVPKRRRAIREAMRGPLITRGLLVHGPVDRTAWSASRAPRRFRTRPRPDSAPPVGSSRMDNVELSDAIADLASLVGRVEETGERVCVVDGGEPTSVLLAAAELAELEHFAQRTHGGARYRPSPGSGQGHPLGPDPQGPYIRYVHAGGGRMTFVRDRVVVAELRSVAELDWLEDRARMARQSYMPPKQAAAFEEFLARQGPMGDGVAWIADSWRCQQPFTELVFIKGPSAKDVALAYGADSQDIANGLLLHQVEEQDAREGTDDLTRVLAFGEENGWTWLGYHDFDHAFSRSLNPPPEQQITLGANMGKAMYTFDYFKDGVYQNPLPIEDDAEDQRDVYELTWYTPGQPPFAPEAPLSFLNLHLRIAEKADNWTDDIALFFEGLERAFNLTLPRNAITSGNVRCARPALERVKGVPSGGTPDLPAPGYKIAPQADPGGIHA